MSKPSYIFSPSRFNKCLEIGMKPNWVLSDEQCNIRFWSSHHHYHDVVFIIIIVVTILMSFSLSPSPSSSSLSPSSSSFLSYHHHHHRDHRCLQVPECSKRWHQGEKRKEKRPRKSLPKLVHCTILLTQPNWI